MPLLRLTLEVGSAGGFQADLRSLWLQRRSSFITANLLQHHYYYYNTAITIITLLKPIITLRLPIITTKQHYILLLPMGSNIRVLLLTLLLSVVLAESESTTLTYFVEYEQQQEEDFIQVELLIQSQSAALTAALKQAKQIATQVTALAEQFCKQHAKKGKGDCKEAVQVANFQIEPQYQKVRKENVFTAFVVSHEVQLNVYSPENIGYLIDNLLKYEDLTIKGIEWLPLDEKDSEEEAVKQGLQQGENLCKQIGLSLEKIVNIEEINEEGDQQEKKEEEEEQQEEEPKITTYKFQVTCAQKAKAKK